MTTVRHALSGDIEFVQVIERSTFSGWIHSIFDKTVNIERLENGELYTVACRSMDNGPNTLVTEISHFHELGLGVNDNVYVENGHLCMGNKLIVPIHQVYKWECRLPDFPKDAEQLQRNLEIMREHIHLYGHTGGMKQGGQSRSNHSFENEVSKMLHERSSLLKHALLNHLPSATQHATSLIGLGPGLTPSGDDFLVGLFTIMSLPNNPYRQDMQWCEETADTAKGLTNDISYMTLKKAAVGKVRASIVNLLHALASPNQDELINALSRVLNIGSSSGTDIALGLICGLEIHIENGGNVCLQKL
ncbi:DUF2877 domain-containing protein [Paenibacillus sp. SC116]|uniref:DUF2877 domain-containing protein n=1 Tax=Paenibacillus sp. SC116 TaxID=2968986 RepID=UPI00215ABE50|nr:DUF2877 domain-containing protein [Paenibacillus sp. SC116]